MSRNYPRPDVPNGWAENHETHAAVAQAIHAIADRRRSADMIWENPTPAEWEAVTMAVEEYVTNGDYPADPDGAYEWGLETIHI